MIDIIDIAMIGNEGYRIPALTTLFSMKRNKKESSNYRINFITDKESNLDVLKTLQDDDFQINLIKVDVEKYKKFDVIKSEIRSATSVSLAKFELWQLIPESNRCIYLDCDLIVRHDLADLYSLDMKGYPIAAVIDSGSIYYKHNYVKKCSSYFNSGVMLLDMKQLRDINATDKLIACKKDLTDSLLMDQDAFNVVFDRTVLLLPIKYNFLYINMIRSTGKWTMDQLNETYKTSYKSLNQLQDESVILHFASKDKPWKNMTVPVFKIWTEYHDELAVLYPSLGIVPSAAEKKDKREINKEPLVSVIIPVFNTGKWLCRALDSVLAQTYKSFEIIIVDDGSSDNSVDILREYKDKDSRIHIYTQKNAGQSTARNRALIYSKGEFIYFFDSDDYIVPQTLEKLVDVATKDKLDLVLFGGGESYYENADLEKQFPLYKTFYKKKKDYPGIYDGKQIYPELVKNKDYNVSPCLQFIRRSLVDKWSIYFYENIIYEDNLFSLQILTHAQRVKVLREEFFIRTVRSQSTMTSVKTEYSYASHQKLMVALIEYLYECREFDTATKEALLSQISYFVRSTLKKYEEYSFGKGKVAVYNTPFEAVIFMLLSNAATHSKDSSTGMLNSVINKFFGYFHKDPSNTSSGQNKANKSNEVSREKGSDTKKEGANESLQLLTVGKSRTFTGLKLSAPVGNNYYHKKIPLEQNFDQITVDLQGVSLSDSSSLLSIGLLDVATNKFSKLVNCKQSKNLKLQIKVESNGAKSYILILYAGQHGKTSGHTLNVEHLEISYYSR